MTMNKPAVNQRRREPLTDTMLLMLISIGIFVTMYVAAMIFLGGSFLTVQNFFNLLNNNAYLIIIGCALTIVMIGGGINISVGGVVGLTAMSCALLMQSEGMINNPMAVVYALLLALAIGLAFGAGMGALVSYLEIQPFIVSLAGMFLARGLTTILSSKPVSITHEGFSGLVSTKLSISFLGRELNGKWIPAKLEIGAMIAILVVVVMFLILRYMKFGRNVYALGGNQQSALMLGINVKRSRFMSYVVSGLLSGLAGYIFIMHTPAGKPSAALRSEMDAIAASIIGGTPLTGGLGNVIGTFFGTMILSTIQRIIEASGVQESYWQEIASGAMLGLFIVLQSVVLSSRAKRKTGKHAESASLKEAPPAVPEPGGTPG